MPIRLESWLPVTRFRTAELAEGRLKVADSPAPVEKLPQLMIARLELWLTARVAPDEEDRREQGAGGKRRVHGVMMPEPGNSHHTPIGVAHRLRG